MTSIHVRGEGVRVDIEGNGSSFHMQIGDYDGDREGKFEEFAIPLKKLGGRQSKHRALGGAPAEDRGPRQGALADLRDERPLPFNLRRNQSDASENRKQACESSGSNRNPGASYSVRTGAACAGSMLYIATVRLEHGSCIFDRSRSRAFHLKARSQQEVRSLTSEILKFVRMAELSELAIASTEPFQYEIDGCEQFAKAALMLVPYLKVVEVDCDAVAEWSLRTQCRLPNGVDAVDFGKAQARAIELAQFCCVRR